MGHSHKIAPNDVAPRTALARARATMAFANAMLTLAVLTAPASLAPSLVATTAYVMTGRASVRMDLPAQLATCFLVRTPRIATTVVHATMALALVKKACGQGL